MLLRLFAAACILFLGLLLTASVWFISSQKRSARDYLDSSLNSMAENIGSYFGTLEKIGFGISSNWSVISIYAGNGYSDANNSIINAFQVTSLAQNIESSVADIMIVDRNGMSKSYFAGIDYDMITEIPNHLDFQDPYVIERNFSFFPPESEWNDIYFVYSFPILSLDPWDDNSPKVASGILLCSKSKLASLLKTDTALPYEHYALYRDDVCVFSSSESFPKADSNTLTAEVEIPRTGLTLKGMVDPGILSGNNEQILLFGCICFVTMALVIFLLGRRIKKYILKPIYDTTGQLISYRGENLSEHIEYSGISEIDTIITDINRMIDKIKVSTQEIILTQNALYETELRTKEAQLYALQSQVNPHFLNNTLQCICGLAAMNRTKDIQEITLAMADVFKYSIHPGTYTDCAEEIDIICQYLAIFKIRYDGKLDYRLDIDESILDCSILKMIIQPTVENAMLHAFVDTDTKPEILIRGQWEGNDLVFEIIDNGTGIPQEKLQKIQKLLERDFSESIQEPSPFGLGLYNINRRIKLVYGESYGIKLFSDQHGTKVRICISSVPPSSPFASV